MGRKKKEDEKEEEEEEEEKTKEKGTVVAPAHVTHQRDLSSSPAPTQWLRTHDERT